VPEAHAALVFQPFAHMYEAGTLRHELDTLPDGLPQPLASSYPYTTSQQRDRFAGIIAQRPCLSLYELVGAPLSAVPVLDPAIAPIADLPPSAPGGGAAVAPGPVYAVQIHNVNSRGQAAAVYWAWKHRCVAGLPWSVDLPPRPGLTTIGRTMPEIVATAAGAGAGGGGGGGTGGGGGVSAGVGGVKRGRGPSGGGHGGDDGESGDSESGGGSSEDDDDGDDDDDDDGGHGGGGGGGGRPSAAKPAAKARPTAAAPAAAAPRRPSEGGGGGGGGGVRPGAAPPAKKARVV